jgi:hypothetical protein
MHPFLLQLYSLEKLIFLKTDNNFDGKRFCHVYVKEMILVLMRGGIQRK